MLNFLVKVYFVYVSYIVSIYVKIENNQLRAISNLVVRGNMVSYVKIENN